jgi:hypothetical protein
MNMGYSNKKGGCGNVKAIITLQAILVIQAVTSSMNLKGCSLKSFLIHAQISPATPDN